LIVGPSTGPLIGLMFVVVTLTAGRERDQTGRGTRDSLGTFLKIGKGRV
jgi:hypothetical protein